MMDVIRHHVDLDNLRKGTLKRKALPDGQKNLKDVVIKRLKKLTKEHKAPSIGGGGSTPTASASKPKTNPTAGSSGSSK